MGRATILLLVAAVSACVAGASRAPDPAVCAKLFSAYDIAARLYPTPRFDEDGGVTPPAALSRPGQQLRNAGCLTYSSDIDGMPALAQRLSPYTITNSGPAIRATPVHLGIVTSIYDEGRTTVFFRGLGYRSRGIGAEALGRRIYIGPFTTQGALDQALATARQAGFIAPYAAKYTRF
jgi:hypothetical protein